MPPDFETLIARYLDRAADAAEVAELSRLIATDESARRLYLRIARLHADLAATVDVAASRAEATATSSPGSRAPAAERRFGWRRSSLAWAAGIAITLAGGALVAWRSISTRAVARFEALHDCRWVGAGIEVQPGDPIPRGQVLQLSSGTVNLRFASGAEATLVGPAIFEVSSGNGGFLTLGQVKVNAAAPTAKGFTVQTRTARVVDIGTEFVTAAAADGQSRVDVTSGEVVVLLAGVRSPQRLRTGDALSIEAGRTQVLVRIESGDGTAAFRFPTIEPPSNRDLADASVGLARIRVIKGTLHTTALIPSGPVELLLDGRGQSQPNSPAESVFFDNNASGLLLLDLGRVVALSKINTYSWHQSPDAVNRVRAVQKFTLYGFAGEVAPGTEGVLTENGWVQLARVNSDDFFHVMNPVDRPAQQACSITGALGAMGRYRYLLWAVEPTQGKNPQFLNNTFYTEFDVYGTP